VSFFVRLFLRSLRSFAAISLRVFVLLCEIPFESIRVHSGLFSAYFVRFCGYSGFPLNFAALRLCVRIFCPPFFCALSRLFRLNTPDAPLSAQICVYLRFVCLRVYSRFLFCAFCAFSRLFYFLSFSVYASRDLLANSYNKGRLAGTV
jgi:hypothetical protein